MTARNGIAKGLALSTICKAILGDLQWEFGGLGGWIPAPRFHEDKLRRKDGGTTSCPRKRVPRGGRWRGDGFLLPVSTRTSFTGMTVGTPSCPRKRVPRGGRWGGASPASQGWIPAPRFHQDKLRRKDGGTTSCPRKRVPRGGRWGGASPAPQGWIPAPRFHEDKLHRNDGGTPSCPRKRVPRGGRWGGASPAPQRWIPAPRFHEDKLHRNDGGTTSCPRKRVPRGGRWGRASPASQGWIPAFTGMTVGRRGEMGPGIQRWKALS